MLRGWLVAPQWRSVAVLCVALLGLVAGLQGCAIERQYAGHRVIGKDIEKGTERVAIRITTCVNPRGYIVCERRYGALDECSFRCDTPRDKWIERPPGYGGYEDRPYTRYMVTLRSPSGETKRVETSQSQYEQAVVGKVLGDAPAAAGGTAPAAAPVAPAAATPPAAPVSPSPGAAMTVAEAQRRLAALGYDAGAADGIAGAKTVQALKAFQASRQLPATGRLDARTVQALQTP